MRPVLAILGLIGLLSLPVSPLLANTLHRDRDPVVLTGLALPTLLGANPDSVVAFRYQAGWVPIPVQVDERAVVNFGTIYNDTTGSGFTILTYTDASTFTGPDPDPTFDTDDELVFMAKEAGDQLAGSPGPQGTLAGSGVVVSIQNPINSAVGYVYLFKSDGSLDPGPGADPVTNAFYLLPSGASYKSQYDTRTGPNPENTVISSANYSVHFSDRWICNAIQVTAGGATGVNILDRRKDLFAPGNCTRSETTFSNGEGALIVNRQGPVRALRGYCGANSGPTTYRIHKFYESREDVLTALRVHPIPGIVDFFDYSAAAAGMTYVNDLNLSGVTIDGTPDAVTLGAIQWEMVTGPQGSLAITHLVGTDIPSFAFTSYYRDLSPAPNQCTGDGSEFGSSGIRIATDIPNTDPALGAYYRFEPTRIIAYAGPGQSAAFAQAAALEAQSAPTATAIAYVPTGVIGENNALAFRLTIGPQPVSARARFHFTLPADGDFSVRIYDVAGRLVATPVLQRMPAGPHDLAWDAKVLSVGVYFVHARLAGVGQRAVKLVVAR